MVAIFHLRTPYQRPTNSYRGRTWLGVGRVLVGGYQQVGAKWFFCRFKRVKKMEKMRFPRGKIRCGGALK